MALLDEEQALEARRLGFALRFGAMLSVTDAGKMGRLEWDAPRRRLALVLEPASRDLFGEVAQARFEALAKALDAGAEVRMA